MTSYTAMKTESITLHNFRCFGGQPTRVSLADDMTALIGANGSGKTALLMALTRLFGVSQSQRTVRRSDFYSPPGGDETSVDSNDLYIEAVVKFPELGSAEVATDAIPPSFNHMVVEGPGRPPVCRIRLEATWTDDATAEGSIEQHLYWILTTEDPPAEDKKRPMSPRDRGLIQVHYVPAIRDPSSEIKFAASSRVGRLLRAVSWSKETRETVEEASGQIQAALGSERAVDAINKLLQTRWNDLHDGVIAKYTNLRFLRDEFEEAIRNFTVAFRPAEGQDERELDELSEGQQSLFYLALVAAVFDVEDGVIQQMAQQGSGQAAAGVDRGDGDHDATADSSEQTNTQPEGPFVTERLRPPALTIFALEEPENHLAPHLLARVIKLSRSLGQSGRAQTVFSSHSPAVLSRVHPEEIRHLRLQPTTYTAITSQITLPPVPSEAHKYVHEAVVSFPELYFARFVLLSEGASEQIVIPKLFEALGLETDVSFVPVVPLGGRHVNHFWRLLSDLAIPYATLLDMDLGRPGGGWGRIKYVITQLISIGVDKQQLLSCRAEDGTTYTLSDDDLVSLHERDLSEPLVKELRTWQQHLEVYKVFFSYPLDMDFVMLRQFQSLYTTLQAGESGPKIPDRGDDKREAYLKAAIETVVADHEPGVQLYARAKEDLQEMFAWYRYLFLTRSKPTTHLLALAGANREMLASNTPEVMRRLQAFCQGSISEGIIPDADSASG